MRKYREKRFLYEEKTLTSEDLRKLLLTTDALIRLFCKSQSVRNPFHMRIHNYAGIRIDVPSDHIRRLFPLGRYYEENGIKYFIQIHECARKERGKIKIKKWLGIANLKAYEDYIWKWHGFLKDCENAIFGLDDKNRNILTLYVLRSFFEAPYRADDENGFYEEFSVKMEEVRKKLDGLKDFS